MGAGRGREFYIKTFVLVQIGLLAGVLVFFYAHQDEIKADLEERPPEPKRSLLLSADSLLNTVSFFTGSPDDGVELVTPARSFLSFCPGQMMWFLLSRPNASCHGRDKSTSGDYRLEQWLKELPAGSRNGVVNFLYDVGYDINTSYSNWNGTAVRELQASPFLPWQKYMDFVVLSSLEDENCRALPFVTNLNPKMLIIAPPVDSERLRRQGNYQIEPHLLQMEPGVTRLLPGLWALVLENPGPQNSSYELDLIVERSDGTLALFVGSALNRPLTALRRAEAEMGKKVSLYAGATGWQSEADMLNVEDEFSELEDAYPDLHWMPNHNTSFVVRGFLEAELGERYHSGRLGSRVSCE